MWTVGLWTAAQVTVGLRPSETLQWSFLNCSVRKADRHVASAANLAFHAAGHHVAVWVVKSGRAGRRQHLVQM